MSWSISSISWPCLWQDQGRRPRRRAGRLGPVRRRGAALFSALVMVSVFACLNANILFGPRVFYAMARDGAFFRSMGRLGGRSRCPREPFGARPSGPPSFACRGPISRSTNTCLRPAPLFCRDGTAVFVLRRRNPETPRPYRTWGYPVVPLIFILTCLAVFSASSARRPQVPAGAGLLAAGWPAYRVWRRHDARRRSGEIKIDTPAAGFRLK